MEVTKLSKDKSEILVQLYDSLEDVLEKGNELDKKILKQINNFNEIESELLKLEEKFDDLKENNSGNLTMTGARDAGDIVKEIILKKQEKDSVLENDKKLYNEYIIITDEIKNIQDNINYILNEEEIETLTTNSGFFVESLGKVHVKSTDMNNVEIGPISENCKISLSNFSNVQEILRIYSKNEEEHTEIENAHDKLVNIYNIRNRQKEEQESLLSLIPKFIETNESKKEDISIKQDNSIVENTVLNENQIDNSNDEITINNNLSIEDAVEEKDNNIIQNPIETNDKEDNLNDVINVVDNTSNNKMNNEINKSSNLNNNVEINLPVSNPLINNVPVGNEIPTLTVPDPVMNSSVDNVLSPTYETNDKQNVPLSEDEVNNILSGGKTDNIVPLDSILNTNQSVNNAPSIEKNTQENVDTILIEKPLKLVKIANSSKEKVQTILNVWSKRPIEKTIIKNVTSNKDEINNVQSVQTPGNDVQQFFLGQAS